MHLRTATDAPPSDTPTTESGHRGSAWEARALLVDGTPVVLRELGPADAEEVLALHTALDDHDQYLRFATIHPADLQDYVRRTLDPAGGAVSLGAWVRGRLVGLVQLLPTGGDGGDVAAVVERAWRAHGVATVLLEHLADLALRLGVRRLLAEVLAANGRMIRVLADLGLPLATTRQGSSLRIEVALDDRHRYATAAEVRHRRAAAAGLEPVLRPRSVALIGVSRSERSVGRAVLRSLRSSGYDGAIALVHPTAGEIDGIACQRTAADLPAGVDLAVVAVPVGSVEEVVGDCGRAGVRAVLLLTSGISGVPGLSGRLLELADSHGMRLVGPNTVGVVGPGGAHRLDTTFTEEAAPPGDIGLVAQSGGIAIAMVSAWARLGLGLSALVAIGDAVDVGARDVLAWLDEHPGTELFVLYAESEPDLRALVPTAAHLAARVPVLAVPAGTSRAGERAAASHTARAATPEALRDAAYSAAGIQTVRDLTGLAAAVGLLRGQPLPGAGTVVVLTNVGGGGVLAADACVAACLPVEPLRPAVQGRLRELLPALASVGNPVDTSAAVSAEQFADALRCLLDDPDVGAVVTVTAPTAVSDPALAVPRAAGAHAEAGGGTPVIDVQLTRPTAVERLELPGTAGRFLISVQDPVRAADALGAAVRRMRWLSRPPQVATAPDGVDVRSAGEVVAAVLSRAPEGDWLHAPEVSALCRAAGIPQVPSTWVATPEEAVTAASVAGGPVAVKGSVAGVVHKADAGLLRLPVSEPAEVGRAVREWRERAGSSWLGALVQPVVPPGDELLVGALWDRSAGPVVALGPGGRAADALGHRVHRLAPVSAVDAADMLEDTGLFAGMHGGGLDRAAVIDCVRRVGWLVDALPGIAELDINPLVVTGRGAVALDVRIRVTPASFAGSSRAVLP